MQLIANISLLFAERPMRDRFAAAATAEFEGVEIQFPYDEDARALREAAGDLPIVLINLPAGNPAVGDVGLATDADRRPDFARGIETALRHAEILKVEKVNILAGPPPRSQAPAVTDSVFRGNARLAAERLETLGLPLMVEAVNPFDVPGFVLDSLDKALAMIDAIDHPSVRLQFDFYHMARTESDLVAAIRRAGPRIGHVQFADAPGRQEPGSGRIDFAAAFAALRRTGYRGAVSAEYRPAGRTEAGLGWMVEARRWLAAAS